MDRVSRGLIEHIKSFVLATGDKTTTVTMTGNLARFVNSTGDVSIVFRGLIPVRSGPGLQFSVNTDLIHLIANWKP